MPTRNIRAPLDQRTWLRPDEVAQILEVDVKAVHKWIKQSINPLPAYLPPGNVRECRINRKELDEWIVSNWQSVATA